MPHPQSVAKWSIPDTTTTRSQHLLGYDNPSKGGLPNYFFLNRDLAMHPSASPVEYSDRTSVAQSRTAVLCPASGSARPLGFPLHPCRSPARSVHHACPQFGECVPTTEDPKQNAHPVF